MKKYEFENVTADNDKANPYDSSYLPDNVEKMGEEGWMLVQVLPRGFNLRTVYVMQREITTD